MESFIEWVPLDLCVAVWQKKELESPLFQLV